MPLPALILDLGGVIFDIDYQLTINAFRQLGIQDAEKLYSQAAQSDTFDLLEKGLISPTQFYERIRHLSNSEPTDEGIRNAWNALLIGIPEENAKFLYELKKKYRLFLLSNTNIIHEAAFRKMISDQYGTFFLEEIFDKMYLSHHLHMRKPDKEIFEFVISDQQLDPVSTLFYDDSIQHVEGAAAIGINSVLFPKGKRLRDVFGILRSEM